MSLRNDACKYDFNIRCVNDTGCLECIRSENEWASKWIQYFHKDTPVIIDSDIPVIELEN